MDEENERSEYDYVRWPYLQRAQQSNYRFFKNYNGWILRIFKTREVKPVEWNFKVLITVQTRILLYAYIAFWGGQRTVTAHIGVQSIGVNETKNKSIDNTHKKKKIWPDTL